MQMYNNNETNNKTNKYNNRANNNTNNTKYNDNNHNQNIEAVDVGQDQGSSSWFEVIDPDSAALETEKPAENKSSREENDKKALWE